MRFLRWFFTGEVQFSGFLVAYVLTPVFSINFTYTFFILSFITCLFRLYKNLNISKRVILPTLFYLLIFATLIFSLLYTPVSDYAIEKVIMFITLTGWSFFGVFFLVKDIDGLKRLSQGVIFFSLIISILMIMESFGTIYGRAGIGGGDNVISIARISGMAIILIISTYVYSANSRGKLLLSILGLFLLSVTLFLTGSRGPLIALIVSMLFFIPLSFRYSFKRMEISYNRGLIALFFIAAISVSALIPVANAGTFDVMFNRLDVLFEEDGGGASAVGRTTRYDTALNMFLDSPLIGQGVGSFGHFYNGVDGKDYAHNIFLEFLSETGLLGFLLFFVFISYTFFVFLIYRRKHKINEYQLAIVVVSVYLLINANVSGDINTNKILFSALALMSLLPLYKESEIVEKQGAPKKRKRRLKRYRIVWSK